MKKVGDDGGGEAVLMEIWKECGDSKNNPRANQWVKINSWIEHEKSWRKPPEDHIP